MEATMIPAFGLMLLIQVGLCVHAVRTGQNMFWLWIILLTGPIGVLVYAVAILIPDLMGGTTARRLGHAARETLDPTRAYRRAKAECDDTPTVANQMRLAHAAAALGRHDEAETLFAAAAHGIHADDPALLLGRANALVELGRFAEALPLLDKLGEDPDKGRTPATALALGRTYEGLGRTTEADTAYQWASERLPGLEAIARYAAFLARSGRRDEAQEAFTEIERRVARTKGPFRAEARAWRDLAAQALG
jgi:hypothetical protein